PEMELESWQGGDRVACHAVGQPAGIESKLQKPNSTNAGAQFGIIMKAQSTERLARGGFCISQPGCPSSPHAANQSITAKKPSHLSICRLPPSTASTAFEFEAGQV
ncbi:hypothetical protein KR074_007659, partial [Drosophila pseudoananassae]